MRVYRYFSLDFGLEALQTKTLKLGRLSELNDPLDCRPSFINVPGCDGKVLDIPKQLDAEIGLLCFSAKYKDPVIWSHYGELHKGLALGFDFPEGNYFKVDYLPDRPVIDWRDMQKIFDPVNPNLKSSWSLLDKAFSTKAEAWSYEAEYRFFHPLNARDMKQKLYFVKFNIEDLKEVIIGARSSISSQEIDRILIHGKYSYSVEIKQCRLDDSTYVLHIDGCPRSSLK